MQEDGLNHACDDPLLLLLYTLYKAQVLLKLINEVEVRAYKKGVSVNIEEIMVNNRFEEANCVPIGESSSRLSVPQFSKIFPEWNLLLGNRI